MIVIADAMAHGTLVDDRWKPSLPGRWAAAEAAGAPRGSYSPGKPKP